jgi:hypothetical protein
MICSYINKALFRFENIEFVIDAFSANMNKTCCQLKSVRPSLKKIWNCKKIVCCMVENSKWTVLMDGE